MKAVLHEANGPADLLRPVVGRSFRLEEVPAAFHYVESGHKVGNVVISVSHP